MGNPAGKRTLTEVTLKIVRFFVPCLALLLVLSHGLAGTANAEMENADPAVSANGDYLSATWLEYADRAVSLKFSRVDATTNTFMDPLDIVSGDTPLSCPRVGTLADGSAVIVWRQGASGRDAYAAFYSLPDHQISDPVKLNQGISKAVTELTLGVDEVYEDATLIMAVFVAGKNEICSRAITVPMNGTSWEMGDLKKMPVASGSNFSLDISFELPLLAVCSWLNDPDANPDTFNTFGRGSYFDALEDPQWTEPLKIISEGPENVHVLEADTQFGEIFWGAAYAYSEAIEDGSSQHGMMVIYTYYIEDPEFFAKRVPAEEGFSVHDPEIYLTDEAFIISYTLRSLVANESGVYQEKPMVFARKLGSYGIDYTLSETDFLGVSETVRDTAATLSLTNNRLYVIRQGNASLLSDEDAFFYAGNSVLQGRQIEDDLTFSSFDLPGIKIGNGFPVADAGHNQKIYAGMPVTLDASGSWDPDAYDSLTYKWEKISGPSVTIDDPDAVQPALTMDAGVTGLIKLRLTVTDRTGNTGEDDMMVQVMAKSDYHHSADYKPSDYQISLSELLRVVQLYNVSDYRCNSQSEDGYGSGSGGGECFIHSSDNNGDWRISLGELLRIIQLYNSGGYHLSPDQPDGVAPDSD